MTYTILQYLIYLVILILLAIPLGSYIGKVMDGEKVFLSKPPYPCEKLIYKLMKVKSNEEMNWKKYIFYFNVQFNGIGLIFLFLLQLLQGHLIVNPQSLPGVPWDLSLNTAISFITNTNWQAYSGESTLGYLTQALGLTVRNFKFAETVQLVEPIAVDNDGNIIENTKIDLKTKTAYVNRKVVNYTEVINKETIPLGHAASQAAIKQTSTNGGCFYGVNSAHPLENPTIISNLLEMISILLIPICLCFTFGRNIKNKNQGIAIFMSMFIVLVIALGSLAVCEQNATPQLSQSDIDMTTIEQSGENM